MPPTYTSFLRNETPVNSGYSLYTQKVDDRPTTTVHTHSHTTRTESILSFAQVYSFDGSRRLRGIYLPADTVEKVFLNQN